MADLISEFLEKSVIESLSVLLSSKKEEEIIASASNVARAFGSGDYRLSSVEDEKKLLSSFRNNLSLLVEKTWVEKRDVSIKEEVLYKLDQYCLAVEKNEWAKSYKVFIKILTDLVYLMFGNQSKTEDFEEYALRIDPEFGIFCWYVKNLPENNDWSDSKSRAIQSVAMFFLANY